jgi:hypothetical protein
MAGQGLSIAASKLAGLSLAAKIGVGATVVTTSVAGAGAAGALPDAADARVRDAIEVVSPVEFDEPAGEDRGPAGDHPDNFGKVVSADATGESDGQPGVDGATISSMAPGAAHRPTDPGQAPAQAGSPDATGADAAGEASDAADVPVDPGAAGTAPSTTPDAGTDAPTDASSTVPTAGGSDAGSGHRPAG